MRAVLAMSDGDPQGGESFFSRWARRKAQERQSTERPGKLDQAPSAGLTAPLGGAAPTPALANQAPSDGVPAETSHAHAPGVAPSPAAPPKPLTLDDVAQLTRDSDYSAFASPQVDPQVRNAALRKLFQSEPHFNVMDRLDVYIDDYSQGESIPKAMLQQMNQARVLGLLDDELTDQDKPLPDNGPPVAVAADTSPAHENTDLQLQRDDAAGPEGAEPGLAGGAEYEPDQQPERPAGN